METGPHAKNHSAQQLQAAGATPKPREPALPRYMKPTGDRNRRASLIPPPPTSSAANRRPPSAVASSRLAKKGSSLLMPAAAEVSTPSLSAASRPATTPSSGNQASVDSVPLPAASPAPLTTTAGPAEAAATTSAQTEVKSSQPGQVHRLLVEVEGLRAELAKARRELAAKSEEAERWRSMYSDLQKKSSEDVDALKGQLEEMRAARSANQAILNDSLSGDVEAPVPSVAVPMPSTQLVESVPEMQAVWQVAQRWCDGTDEKIRMIERLLGKLQDFSLTSNESTN